MPQSIESIPSTSRSSSSSGSSVVSFTPENAPVQLDDSHRPARRPSVLRRFSSATQSYLSNMSIPSAALEEDTHLGLRRLSNIHTNDLNHDYLFGRSHLNNINRTRETDEETSAASLEEFPRMFNGSEPSRRPSFLPPEPPTRRDTIASVIQSITHKFGFWDEDFHSFRIQMVLTYLTNYLYLIVGFVGALCVYWGSYYDRTSRYPHLRFGVVIADTTVGSLPPIIGSTVEYFFTNVSSIQQLGHFDIVNYTSIADLAANNGRTITQEVYHQVHHQKYWAIFYVKQNATFDMYQQLVSGVQSINPAIGLMEAVYETGRDFNGMNNFISSLIMRLVNAFSSFAPKSDYSSAMVSTLNSSQVLHALSTSSNLLTNLPNFKLVDNRPITNPVVQAPFQIGLIYLIVFSFFQFVFSIEIHKHISSKYTGVRYLTYRLLVSHLAYVVIGLAFVTLNTAFSIKFTTAFGHSGFLVVWAFSYLNIASLGSLIEALVLNIASVKPQLVGFILLFVAVTNMAPTVSPIVLCPVFYRYGYAMPLHNVYELMHVAYFDSYKGHVGRNIGILVAWLVISTAALIFTMTRLAAKMKKAQENAVKETEGEKPNDSKAVDEKDSDHTADVADEKESGETHTPDEVESPIKAK